ncbi:MAG: hypothetical protein IT435_18295 [Phycisphaerales bacterium]|nr:hypothetical protein [Phycisphaerales bacterium]
MSSRNTLFGRSLLAGLAVGMLTGTSAWSQVAPPPPEAPAKTPEFTPPPLPKTPRVIPSPGGADPAKIKQLDPNKGEGREMIKDRVQGGKLKVPDGFNAEVLVKRDADGKLIRYDRPLPWLALESNELVSDKQREDIKPSLHRRNLQHEVAAVNNLDLVIKIDQGEIERLDPRDRRQLAWAERTTKLLRAGGMLSEWLNVQGMLSDEQAAGNQAIGDAYGRALLEQVRKDAGEDRQLQSTVITRELFKNRIDEPMFVYRMLCERVAGMVDECLAGTDMPEDIRKSLAPEVAAVKAASTVADRRQALTALLLKMPDWVMQHQFMDVAINKEYNNREVALADGNKVRSVMAYQVETARRREEVAKGKTVGYEKEPPRPVK